MTSIQLHLQVEFSHFDYDKDAKSLIICSYNLKKILFYSIPELTFVKAIELDIYPEIALKCEDDLVIVGYDGLKRIIGYIKNEEVDQMAVPSNNVSLVFCRDVQSITKYDQQIIYSTNSYNNQLYSINKDGANAIYNIDFGSKSVDKNGILDGEGGNYLNDFVAYFTEKERAGIVHNASIEGDFVSFNYVNTKFGYDGVRSAVYNKSTKELNLYSKIAIAGTENQINPIARYKDFFVAVISPDMCMLNGGQVKDKVGDMVYEISQDENDIGRTFIVLYRLK